MSNEVLKDKILGSVKRASTSRNLGTVVIMALTTLWIIASNQEEDEKLEKKIKGHLA